MFKIAFDWLDGLVPKVGNDLASEDLERLRGMAGGSQGARPKFFAIIDKDNSKLLDHRSTLAEGWRHVLIRRRAQGGAGGAVGAEAAYGDVCCCCGR